MCDKCGKLCIGSFGLACGILWAFAMLAMGIVATKIGYGITFVNFWGNLYIGYKATMMGSLIGAGWALLDGFVFGIILAWLYNLFASCCCKKSHE